MFSAELLHNTDKNLQCGAPALYLEVTHLTHVVSRPRDGMPDPQCHSTAGAELRTYPRHMLLLPGEHLYFTSKLISDYLKNFIFV